MAEEKKPPIATVLRKSPAFRSLAGERTVAEILRRNDWESVQSAYYVDQDTRKVREIDVSARQLWSRSARLGSVSAMLYCFVECKTLDGYHILVAPMRHRSVDTHCLASRWTSGNHRIHARLQEALRAEGLTELQIHKVLDGCESIAFPGGAMSLASEVLVTPPPADVVGAAFRETNIGVDRDLDASILWKARQALGSVVRSHKETYYDVLLEDMRTGPGFAIHSGTDAVSETLRCFRYRISTAHIYHPIIVLECSLWKAHRSGVAPIDAFRLVEVDTRGWASFWCDVVSLASAESFIEKLSGYYRRFYRAARTRRLRQ